VKVTADLIRAAVRLAADAPKTDYSVKAGRTMVKRSLVEDLRRALDHSGLGDEWRTLHDIVRIEERQPATATGAGS
jgi:hypothetical protein